MNRYLILLLMLFSIWGFAQEDTHNYFRNKINTVENDFKQLLEDREYIIYTTPYIMHLILNKEDNYYDFIFTAGYNDDFKIKNIEIINNKEIKNVFRKKNYEKGIIDGTSEYYKNNPIEEMNGLPTYFSFNINFQKRYCEYFLSVMIKPVPMDFNVFRFLSFLMLDFKPSRID